MNSFIAACVASFINNLIGAETGEVFTLHVTTATAGTLGVPRGRVVNVPSTASFSRYVSGVLTDEEVVALCCEHYYGLYGMVDGQRVTVTVRYVLGAVLLPNAHEHVYKHSFVI